jgi:hypothetical protein
MRAREVALNERADLRMDVEAAQALVDWKSRFADEVAAGARRLAVESSQPEHDPQSLGQDLLHAGTTQSQALVNHVGGETGTLQLLDPNFATDGGGFTVHDEPLTLNGPGVNNLGALTNLPFSTVFLTQCGERPVYSWPFATPGIKCNGLAEPLVALDRCGH